jgi:hypothetical protein
MKTGSNFILQHFKNKIIFHFVIFLATKKGMTTNFFSPLSCVQVLRSGVRDPGWVKNQDPRSWIWDKHPGSATLLGGL